MMKKKFIFILTLILIYFLKKFHTNITENKNSIITCLNFLKTKVDLNATSFINRYDSSNKRYTYISRIIKLEKELDNIEINNKLDEIISSISNNYIYYFYKTDFNLKSKKNNVIINVKHGYELEDYF